MKNIENKIISDVEKSKRQKELNNFCQNYRNSFNSIVKLIIYKYHCELFDAENIASKVMEIILINKNQYNFHYCLSTWINTIIKNEFVNFKRSKKDLLNISISLSDVFTDDGNEKYQISVYYEFDNEIDYQIIYNDLIKKSNSLLNNIEKEIFRLRFIDDYKNTEISELLNISEINVRVIISRIKIELKQKVFASQLCKVE